MTKPYNLTDLNPEQTFARHVYHRDQFAHYLRWSHVLKVVRANSVHGTTGTSRRAGSIVDFGCGRGDLLEVCYRNRFAPVRYVGLDIREKVIAQANEKWGPHAARGDRDWRFICDDLVFPETDMSTLQGDFVCSFEVAEHVGRQNVPAFLQNFKKAGASGATYFLSTPNYDGKNAASNHTYDSGRLDEHGQPIGVEVHELEYNELRFALIDSGFDVVDQFATFASKRDYVKTLTATERETYERLNKYYDSEVTSVLMAPLIEPRLGRNIMWVLKKT